MPPILLLSALLLSCCLHAQTTLSFVAGPWGDEVDRIEVRRAGGAPLFFHPKKMNRLRLEEPFANYCNLSFYAGDRQVGAYNGWIDTGRVELRAYHDGLQMRLVAPHPSPLTARADAFYVGLGTFTERTDTAEVNRYLLEAYRREATNPFSFAIGELFYQYNRNAPERFALLTALESNQAAVLKKSIHWAMMSRARLRPIEGHLLHYLRTTPFPTTAGSVRSLPAEGTPVVFAFFGAPTESARKELERWAVAQSVKKENRIYQLAVDGRYRKDWAAELDRLRLTDALLIRGDDLQKEAFLEPLTRIYLFRRGRVDSIWQQVEEMLEGLR